METEKNTNTNVIEDENKEYKTNKLKCCKRQFKLKHKKGHVVRNENLNYIGIIIYYLRKWMIDDIIKYYKFYVLTILYIFGAYFIISWLGKSISLSNEIEARIDKCIIEKLKCEVLKNNCIEVYNKIEEDLNADKWYVKHFAEKDIKRCLDKFFNENTFSKELDLVKNIFVNCLYNMFLFVLFLITLNLIVMVIYEFFTYVKNICKEYYKENIPEVETVDDMV